MKPFIPKIHQANLKCTFQYKEQLYVIYRRLEHINPEYLQYAIKNLASKFGLTSVETITPQQYEEEYESNT